MIHYTVSFESANAHLFDVRLNLNFGLNQGQEFYLPNWIPGSYMIRDFAKNIVSLSANCKGESVLLEKRDKSTWILSQEVSCLEINYQVYAWDLSVRSAYLDNQQGFFNGTSLFLAVKGMESETHHLQLMASQNAQANQWLVATSMANKTIDENGFGKYFAADYDEFIDHPFSFAPLKKLEFEVANTPHVMYFSEAPANVDWQRIADDVSQICAAEIAFFGEKKPPFEQYVFMTQVLKNGFGGLEHRASTALQCCYDDLPLVGQDKNKLDPKYRTFLSLCCHEYFHAWNIKRIKPARFIPLDMSKEVNTQLLWFFEGITSYYDELLMARSGVVNEKDYLDMLAQTLTRTYRSQGRFKQTISESSFDAWTKFYKQDENAVNAIVSYYSKGAMVAFALDFEIRKLTNQKKSLDDLMRLIWKNYGKTGKGLGETQVQHLAKELVGESMEGFFNKALHCTEDLDLNEIFKSLGIKLQILPQYLQAEKGGFVSEPKDRKPLAFLGVSHKNDPLGAKVHSVVNGSCGANAGLSNGDIIIALDSYRVQSSELDEAIAKIPLGTEISISYFRRERLYQAQCLLTASEANSCYLSFIGEPNEPLTRWLKGH